jgi:fibronectin-binding autotransporter adhesin
VATAVGAGNTGIAEDNVMTAISWNSAVNGGWTTASNWNPAQVPGSADDVTIAATGASYQVLLSDVPNLAAHSLTLDSATARLVVETTLTMGGPLTIDAGTLRLIGAISGGSIVANGGTLLSDGGILQSLTYEGTLALTAANHNSLTLEAVTFQGTIDLTGAGAEVAIDNLTSLSGTGGNGAATIDLTGAASELLLFGGTHTFDNATIDIGNDTSVANDGGVLTLGSKLALMQTGAGAELFDGGSTKDGIINQGSIRASYRGGNFSISGNSFTNQGTISVFNDDTLSIDATHFINAGSISVTNGATLDIGGTVHTSGLAGISVSNGGLLTLGTLINSGATLHDGTGTALGTVRVGEVIGGVVDDTSGGLDAGVLDDVSYQGTLDVDSSLTIQAGITLSGVGGSGPGTVNLMGILEVFGTPTLRNATINIGNGGTLFSYDVLGNGAMLTLGSNVVVTQTGATANLQDSGNATDAVINQGSIVADFANGQLNISGNKFANLGSVATSNGDTLNMTSAIFGNAIPATLSGDGTISSTANNYGTIIASGGDTLAFLHGVTNDGTMEASSGVLSSQNSIGGTGTLDIGATGTLSLLQGASSGQTVDFLAATGSLDLSVPLDFQGTITAFGNSNLIDLINTPETGFSYSGGVLSVQNGSATVASLHFAGSYTQANFVLGTDGHGGTNITFA